MAILHRRDVLRGLAAAALLPVRPRWPFHLDGALSVLDGPADDERKAWWRDARFGMFVHWGLYAILAGEWGGRTDYGEWIRNNAQIPIGEYDKLVARFNPTKLLGRRVREGRGGRRREVPGDHAASTTTASRCSTRR